MARVKDMDPGLLPPKKVVAPVAPPSPTRSNVREDRTPIEGAQQTTITHTPTPTPSGDTTPKGSPGKAWVWNGTQWIQPPRPSANSVWDNDAGWTTPSSSGSGSGGGSGSSPNGPAVVTPVAGGGGDSGALQIITDALNSVGLGSLAGNAWDMWNKGLNMNAIMNDPKTGIRASEAYKARFPGMKALNDAGHGISEMDYIAKENTDRGLLYQYLGSAAKAFDNTANLGSIISGFKSSVEFEDHLQGAHDALNASPETKAWLKSTYNLSDGDLAAYWLNPDVAGLDIQRRDQAGQLAGISAQSGFGQLTQAQAEELAKSGVTNSQAHNVFGQIGQEGEFMKNLPGETPDALTQQQMLDAAYQGGDALAALNRTRAGRVAKFQEGGGFAQDSKGVVGLDTAATL